MASVPCINVVVRSMTRSVRVAITLCLIMTLFGLQRGHSSRDALDEEADSNLVRPKAVDYGWLHTNRRAPKAASTPQRAPHAQRNRLRNHLRARHLALDAAARGQSYAQAKLNPMLKASDNRFMKAIRPLYRRYGDRDNGGGELTEYHNIEHAENIQEYAERVSSSLWLSDAAFAHDVMHPGTANNVKDATEFSELVKAKFSLGPEYRNLERFAKDVYENGLKPAGFSHVDVCTAMGRGRLGKMPPDFKESWEEGMACDNEADAQKYMMNFASQETLHSWVTMQNLRERDSSDDENGKMLMSILLTSISLHFKLEDMSGYVKAMAQMTREKYHPEDTGCLLLLHLLDMGWCSQGDASRTLLFGPRFLLESGWHVSKFGKAPTSFGEVLKGEVEFAQGDSENPDSFANKKSVLYFVNELRMKGCITQDFHDSLASGIATHVHALTSNDGANFRKALSSMGHAMPQRVTRVAPDLSHWGHPSWSKGNGSEW